MRASGSSSFAKRSITGVGTGAPAEITRRSDGIFSPSGSA